MNAIVYNIAKRNRRKQLMRLQRKDREETGPEMPYVPKPTPCFLDQFEFYKVIDGRKVYRSKNRYFSWDELHGEIEAFDKRGFHLGALDAISGKMIKGATKGRRLHV